MRLLLIIVLLPIITLLLEAIRWHGYVKNKILLLDSVSRLSIEPWLTHLVNWCILKWVSFYNKSMMMMSCDNQAAIYIVSNHVFHERTKYNKVNSNFIREMVIWHIRIVTSFVTSSCQLRNIFTKALFRNHFSILCSKLGMIDIYNSNLRGNIKVFDYYSYLLRIIL